MTDLDELMRLHDAATQGYYMVDYINHVRIYADS